MIVRAIKIRPLIPPQDDLLSAITESFSGFKLKENSIIVITSKVVSIWQGRCVKIEALRSRAKTQHQREAFGAVVDGKFISKDKLIIREANLYISRSHVPKNYAMLTIKNNILIPTSGIDESNAKGHYILWPEHPFSAAEDIYNFIKKRYKLKKFGVIISDSHTAPLRSGITGLGIAYYGFSPLRDYRGKKDIFGREIKMSQANIVDALASAAVFLMGEGSEQTPIAVIEDAGDIKFDINNFSKKNQLEIDIDEDIYAPILKNKKWKKGGAGSSS